jgi:hypothetical protein
MRLPIIVLLAIVAALSACSGEDESGGSESGTGPTLSRAEYEERYVAVRKENADEVEDLQQELESALRDEDAGGIADALDEFAQLTRSVADQLGDLRPPSDVAGEHDGYVAVLRDTASGYEDVAEAAADAPTFEAALAELEQLVQVFGGEENQRRVRAFARAVEQGGYDLGFAAGEGGLPGPSPVP